MKNSTQNEVSFDRSSQTYTNAKGKTFSWRDFTRSKTPLNVSD